MKVGLTFQEWKQPSIPSQYKAGKKGWPALLSGGCCYATRKGGEFC